MPNPATPTAIGAALPSRLPEESATIVGLGAVGRQVALHLTALGIRRLRLVDDAVVLAGDIAAGFRAYEVGRPRADAVLGACFERVPLLLDGESHIDTFPAASLGSVFFCEGDAARLLSLSAVDSTTFCGAAYVTDQFVYVATRIGGVPAPHRSSFTAAPSYAAGFAAALLIRQYLRHLSGRPLDAAAVFDLEAGSYAAGSSRD